MGRRKPGEPGGYQPLGGGTCGYDAGITGGPPCGKPATWHLHAGTPPETLHDYCMTSCDEHLTGAQALAIDWHPFGPVCDMPGAMWAFRERQGAGFCFWPEAEQITAEQITDRNQPCHHKTSTPA